MSKKYVPEYLVHKYIDGVCTDEEQAIVESWHNKDLEESTYVPSQQNISAVYTGMRVQVLEHAHRSSRRAAIWSGLSIAAAILITLSIGLLFYTKKFESESQIQISREIQPGGNKALITLSNGKKIQLSDKKTGVVLDGIGLAYNDGSVVVSAAEVISGSDDVEVRTPRGGTYNVTLPDGTKIWMNADSKITFPSKFNGKERRIILSGEAYMEVAKLSRPSLKKPRFSERIPFIVVSKGQQVEVLGTHFNISSYPDESNIKTTLIEGGVRVTNSQRQAILKPGEQSICTGSGITVKQADAEEALGWKNGTFIFKEQSIAEIMKAVARWYDVTVVFSDDFNDQETFSGQISRSSQITEILKSLQSTGKVKFRNKGKIINVSY